MIVNQASDDFVLHNETADFDQQPSISNLPFNLTALLISKRPDLSIEEIKSAASILERAIAEGYLTMSENDTTTTHVAGILSPWMVGAVGVVVVLLGLAGYLICFVAGMRGKLDIQRNKETGKAENKLYFTNPLKKNNSAAAPNAGGGSSLTPGFPMSTRGGSDQRSLAGSTDESVVVCTE